MNSACIEYIGHRDKDGYGRVYSKEFKTQVSAHRLAYCNSKGLKLADIHLKIVRHTCDNPCCINPEHLELGAQVDNQADVKARGRLGLRLGETNNQAVLTNAQVEQLRAEYENKRGVLTALGKKYGVSRVTVKNIVSGRYR